MAKDDEREKAVSEARDRDAEQTAAQLQAIEDQGPPVPSQEEADRIKLGAAVEQQPQPRGKTAEQAPASASPSRSTSRE